MRLTLRTLLAYRDGVLDPKDAAVLEAKILDSSTAQQISQRISDEMRNRKLAPIPVDAREFGFEANMVAEFLDDTIPMETLPEMERKCLENNTLLSEIGSCHQILSRALSIPAPISSTLRQRIHDLPNNPAARSFSDAGGRIRRFDAGSPSEQNSADSLRSTIAISSNKTVRKSNGELRGSGIELNDGLGRQVPEYLIGNDRGWLKTIMLGLALLTSLVVVGAIAVGPIDRVQNLLRKSELAKVVPEDTAIEVVKKEKEQATKLPPEKDPNTDESDTGEKGSDIIESSVGPPPPAATLSNVPDKLKPNMADGSKGTKPKVSESNVSPPIAKNRIQWLPETKESSEMIVLKLGATESGAAPFWRRMHAGEYVAVGERIVVPPTQRTEMRLEPGIRFLCAGENDFEQSKGGVAPSVTIRSGLFFLFATPDASVINLDCNGVLLTIRFASADGGCALEMQNEWSSSTDDMAKAGMLASSSMVRLIGVQGEIEYSMNEVGGVESKGTLSVGQFTRWKDGKPSGLSELVEEPWWFRTSVTRPIDQLASKALQRALIGREPGVIESELTEHMSPLRIYELTVSLAVRTRIMLGRYDGLFESDGVFNRGNLHIHWASLFSQVAQSMGRDENRSALADAIRHAAPNRASTLFSLLALPTQEQLEAGSDKLLVDSLSSPQMDERVIAFQQLNQITGKTLMYHPDKNPAEGAQAWRKLLSKDEIRYSNPSKP
jgi:hypothetical protein